METDILMTLKVGTESHTPFPGNSDIVVSHDVEILPLHRGQGLGSTAHSNRLRRLANDGYSVVMCTVRDDNEAQKKILSKNKWIYVYNFLNKDGDKIHIYLRHLQT